MFLFVFWGGYMLLAWQTRRQNRDEMLANQFVNWGVAGILIGAWFAHRFFYEWEHILANPLYLIDLRQGLAGLSSHGATAGLILSIIWFARKYKLPVGWFMDSLTFGTALSAMLVRLGNFFNSEIIGRPADVPWAVCLPRVDALPLPRHPSQLYEAAAGLALLLILLAVDRIDGGARRRRWVLTGTCLTVYFALRFVVEFFKEHQALESGITMGQWLSVPFFGFGLWLLGYGLTRGVREAPVTDPVDGQPNAHTDTP
ncbi:MAG: phosphatidylglycerol:prolipoprotein diacylglycerol transferase [Myxococcota bacterium]|jgi:phosphatidylglycerol:prolipoprotein diacylglycerol transferase